MESTIQVQNLGEAVCVSLCGNVMDSSVLLPIGKYQNRLVSLVLVGQGEGKFSLQTSFTLLKNDVSNLAHRLMDR